MFSKGFCSFACARRAILIRSRRKVVKSEQHLNITMLCVSRFICILRRLRDVAYKTIIELNNSANKLSKMINMINNFSMRFQGNVVPKCVRRRKRALAHRCKFFMMEWRRTPRIRSKRKIYLPDFIDFRGYLFYPFDSHVLLIRIARRVKSTRYTVNNNNNNNRIPKYNKSV